MLLAGSARRHRGRTRTMSRQPGRRADRCNPANEHEPRPRHGAAGGGRRRLCPHRRPHRHGIRTTAPATSTTSVSINRTVRSASAPTATGSRLDVPAFTETLAMQVRSGGHQFQALVDHRATDSGNHRLRLTVVNPRGFQRVRCLERVEYGAGHPMTLAPCPHSDCRRFPKHPYSKRHSGTGKAGGKASSSHDADGRALGRNLQ